MSGDALLALADRWEARGRKSHPADTMLINRHVRELREAITSPDAGRECLEQAIDAALLQHGSYRNAAKALGVDHVYLHRLRKGAKDNPSTAVQAALGVTRRATVTYTAALTPQEQPT